MGKIVSGRERVGEKKGAPKGTPKSDLLLGNNINGESELVVDGLVAEALEEVC
jgi:hypothetical protein